MEKRKIGPIEGLMEEWNEGARNIPITFTMKSMMVIFFILAMLAGMLLIFEVFAGEQIENKIARVLIWIWFLSWSIGVIMTKEEMEEIEAFERRKIPMLD